MHEQKITLALVFGMMPAPVGGKAGTCNGVYIMGADILIRMT